MVRQKKGRLTPGNQGLAVVVPVARDTAGLVLRSMSDAKHPAHKLLPKQVQDFVRHVGIEDAMALVRGLRGTALHVPLIAHEHHAAAHMMTGNGWAKFCRVYGGQRLRIPKCDQALQAVRNAKIVADYSPPINMSTNELCLKYGLTQRRVEVILSMASKAGADALAAQHLGGGSGGRGGRDDRTMDLFGS